MKYLFHLGAPPCTVPKPSGPVEFKQRLHRHGESGSVYTYNGHEVVGPDHFVANLEEEQNQPEEQDEQTQLQQNQQP